jgi:hypothetical protein
MPIASGVSPGTRRAGEALPVPSLSRGSLWASLEQGARAPRRNLSGHVIAAQGHFARARSAGGEQRGLTRRRPAESGIGEERRPGYSR